MTTCRHVFHKNQRLSFNVTQTVGLRLFETNERGKGVKREGVRRERGGYGEREGVRREREREVGGQRDTDLVTVKTATMYICNQ